jgi:DNA-binding MarR family transcriptional regulator
MVPVTHGHEVSKRRTAVHDQYAHHILSEIEAGHPISQRSLASSLGIALGMTNLLLRRLVRKGWVRVSHIRPNRVGYFLTPTGMAEKARMSRGYFQDSVRLYASARDRIRHSFEELSRSWPAGASDPATNVKRIMFLGTGEAAEIAYVCLQETDLELTGVIDFQGRARFFGVPVHPGQPIQPALRDCLASKRPVVVVFGDGEQAQTFISAAGVPPERVFWI